jgi:hypothetical protein
VRELTLMLVTAVVLFGRAETPEIPGRPAHQQIVADTGGAFGHLVLHFDPRAEAAVAPTYRDLLRALEPTVRFSVVVGQRSHFDRFARLLTRWRIPNPARFQPVVVGRDITTWSRDRYILLTEGRKRLLLVQPEPHRAIRPRANDWYAPFAIARALGRDVEVRIAPVTFDGGDLTATSRHAFATGLLLGRTAANPYGAPERLSAWLRQMTGREPVILGRGPEDVPPHHVGMFLTPLDDPAHTVLVGDPLAGLKLLPPDAALPLPVDRRPATLRRFAFVADALTRAGFRVVRVPLVPLSDGVTYVTYNNAILERRTDGRLHAYVPQFGLAALDAAGRAAYARQGVVVHPIDVRRIYRHNGTVRCLVNVLARHHG